MKDTTEEVIELVEIKLPIGEMIELYSVDGKHAMRITRKEDGFYIVPCCPVSLTGLTGVKGFDLEDVNTINMKF